MMRSQCRLSLGLAALFLAFFVPNAVAQNSVTILSGSELARVVPPGFYFEGLTAPTQMRNSAAARFGSKRYVIAGMVDTGGYAADVRAKYEGFFITDSRIKIKGPNWMWARMDLVSARMENYIFWIWPVMRF